MERIKELIKIAMRERDAESAGNLSDRMRGLGLNYKAQIAVVESLGFDGGDWEDLMYEADSLGR